MPLYEYLCHKCGKKFDALQKFDDPPLTVHEEDGGAVERLISPPAFHFKGSGWYVTDYAKSNGVSAPGSEGTKAEGTKTESSGSDGKTETKTEAKAESAKPAPAPASSEK